MDEVLQRIRGDLRRSMNGVASKSMREKGLDYKLNFGVEIPRLRQLSKRYPAHMDLAERLWKLETRELKILASMLYPVDAFDMEKARQWVNEIPNQEIREQVCMNLFQRLEFADKLVEEWTGSDNGEVRATGYWLFARLLIIRSELVNQIDPYAIMEKMVADLESGSYFLRLSAQRALTFLGRSSATFSQKILAAIQDFNSSDDIVKNEIFESLNFEFTNFPG